MSRIFFLILVSAFVLSSCASRGFELSQQMPGYDKHLNPVSLDQGYNVDEKGDIVALSPKSVVDRGIASRPDNIAYATLDPQFGALLIGKSSTQKQRVNFKHVVEAPPSAPIIP